LHSSYIIKNSEIFGLSRNENKIISEIAKYHKGSSVPQDDESFHLMSRIDRLTILKLTAILRIADAMDRGHIQKFSDFTIKLEQNAFIINTKKSKNTLLEKIALTEKAGMFESVFGYKVMLM
jgi:exopolyphosphatase/guanosine-5'-triphosphate,3'-diphosphate pyrophosphatase